MTLCTLSVIPAAALAQTEAYSFSVVPDSADIRSARMRVTQQRVDRAIAISAGVDTTASATLQRARRQIPSLVAVPSIPANLRRYGARPTLAEVVEVFARLKAVARRAFDRDAFQRALQNMTPEEFSRLASDLAQHPEGTPPYRSLGAVDSLSTAAARFLDPGDPAVRELWYRLSANSNTVGEDRDGPISPAYGLLGRRFRGSRQWTMGEPVVVFATGSWGENPNPLHTSTVVSVSLHGRVHSLYTFSSYGGTSREFTLESDHLDMPAHPVMALDRAKKLVREETGERPVGALYINPYITPFLLVPAVLTSTGSVYLVDPIIEYVW